jgi:protein-S-isoprenylcysteine O-methyltransferase Ste14
MATDPTQPESELPRPSRVEMWTIMAMFIVLAGFTLLARQHGPGWTLGWIYVCLFVAGMGIFKNSFFLWNPDLAWRRMPIGSGTKTWDWVWLAAFGANIFAILFLAVDSHTRVADLHPRDLSWLAGLTIFVSGLMFSTWSSFWNPFFEATVRIQAELGHRVMDEGPYSVIRHPAYVGFIATFISTPLLLPSSGVVVLSLSAALLFVIRTALEDRTLQAELPGYAEYATRVRFRLIPGVW